MLENYYETLDILRSSTSRPSDVGSIVASWSRISFKGVVYRKQGQASNLSGKSGEQTDAVLICEVCDIRKGDRILDSNGEQFLIKSIPNNPLKLNHHLEAELMYVTGVDIRV